MKKCSRKIAAGFLSLLAVVSLAGCGNSASQMKATHRDANKTPALSTKTSSGKPTKMSKADKALTKKTETSSVKATTSSKAKGSSQSSQK